MSGSNPFQNGTMYDAMHKKILELKRDLAELQSLRQPPPQPNPYIPMNTPGFLEMQELMSEMKRLKMQIARDDIENRVRREYQDRFDREIAATRSARVSPVNTDDIDARPSERWAQNAHQTRKEEGIRGQKEELARIQRDIEIANRRIPPATTFDEEIDHIIQTNKPGKGMMRAYYDLESVRSGTDDETRPYTEVESPHRSVIHSKNDMYAEQEARLLSAATTPKFKEKHDVKIVETLDGTRLLVIDGMYMNYNDVANAVACYTSEL